MQHGLVFGSDSGVVVEDEDLTFEATDGLRGVGVVGFGQDDHSCAKREEGGGGREREVGVSGECGRRRSVRRGKRDVLVGEMKRKKER